MFATIKLYSKPTQSSKYNKFLEKTDIITKGKNGMI